MNNTERSVKSYFECKGHKVTRHGINKPDFLIDNNYYVEVKDVDKKGNSSHLSENQIYEFSKIKKDIYLFHMSRKRIIAITKFDKRDYNISKKKIKITLEIDKDLWTKFKESVPRTKTLNQAVVELIKSNLK